ncbi:hypothetical protein [Empedobacter brevis]|uniref:hypothetical protein n=1 Tax=Empedobacter brevis TaxID=247 RepID=UPI0028A03B04|nr:hypothetical protein [Empedobacter brevis]
MNKNLKYYFGTTILFILLEIILNQFDLHFRGINTYRVLAWLWIFTTILFIIVYWKKKLIKIYTIILVALIGLSILPMALPFFAILSFLTGSNSLQHLKIDDDYRIELNKQILSKERVYIYRTTPKMVILEKSENLCRPDYLEVLSKVLDISEENESLYTLKNSPIQQAKLVAVNKDSIGIEYQILHKKKIIYHQLNERYGY